MKTLFLSLFSLLFIGCMSNVSSVDNSSLLNNQVVDDIDSIPANIVEADSIDTINAERPFRYY